MTRVLHRRGWWRVLAALVVALLLFTSSTQAANPVPVVVKLLPGANLSLITNLLGGTVIDSIPEANTYLLKLPALPLLSPVLKLLGVEWLELDRGVSQPANGQLKLLDVPWSIGGSWDDRQPALG